MKSILQILLFLTTAMFLGGCSQLPSTDDGRKAVEDWLDLPHYGKELKLVSFTKVNGQKGQIQNAEGVTVQSYSLEYRGEVEAVQRCALTEPRFISLERDKGKIFTIPETDEIFNSFSNSIVNVGQSFTIIGTIVFEKTEKGWKRNRIVNQILFDRWLLEHN